MPRPSGFRFGAPFFGLPISLIALPTSLFELRRDKTSGQIDPHAAFRPALGLQFAITVTYNYSPIQDDGLSHRPLNPARRFVDASLRAGGGAGSGLGERNGMAFYI